MQVNAWASVGKFMANHAGRRQKLSWQKAYPEVEPQINADGTYVHPFEPAFPVDVRLHLHGGRNNINIRMNRHTCLEVMYIYDGETDVQIQDRYVHLRKGDLMIVGNNLYHRVIGRSDARMKLVCLMFEPELIRAASPGDEAEYLMPFLMQDD
jgi:mannose-6-phosphate isomerase-like protein (cupin superfamily)